MTYENGTQYAYIGLTQQPGLWPRTMIETLKRISNALAFANVATLGELRTRLRSFETRPETLGAPPVRTGHEPAPAITGIHRPA